MVIIQLMGGLGNQLQQYAFYRKLNKCGIEAKIDTSWYGADVQKNMAAPRTMEIKRLGGIEFEEASSKEVARLIGDKSLSGKFRRKMFPNTIKIFEENSRVFVPEFFDSVVVNRNIKDIYTKAHFACEYYYADILEDLRNEVSFPLEQASNSQQIKELAEKMSDTESVSIHIRRGDYLDDINAKYYGGICTEEYYESAVKYLVENAGANRFFIFSDDKDYATDFAHRLMKKKNSEITAEVIDINHGDDSMFDIYLMSRCRHNITANSTFSFWGARFNAYEDKIMIRPTKHINQQPFDSSDMKKWWAGWTFVSPEGKIY